MSWSKSFLTLALCFGLGLGLAPLLHSAHACSCEEIASWQLELDQITGNGEITVEQAFWPTEWVSLNQDNYGTHDRTDLGLFNQGTLALERVP